MSRARRAPRTLAQTRLKGLIAMRGFRLTVRWTARSFSITLEPY
jgi:hypothetical protein